MGNVEIGRCGFCNDVKPVNRFYMYPSLYKKPENTKGLYNDGDYFIITYWCNDCGKPAIEKNYYDPNRPLFKDANDVRDFLAKNPDMFSYTPGYKDLEGLIKQIEARSKIKNNVDNIKSYLRKQPDYIRYQGYPNDLRQEMHSDYIKRENANHSPSASNPMRKEIQYLEYCLRHGKKLHQIHSGISWVRNDFDKCIGSNGTICTLKFVLDDIEKYPTLWVVVDEERGEKELFSPEAKPKPKLSMFQRFVNAIRNKINSKLIKVK